MKVFVFLRGSDTPLKERVSDLLMQHMNPNPDQVWGYRVRLRENIIDGQIKAADKTCKNIVRKLLSSTEERFIVIDNPNILPVHWQSYMMLADKIAINAICVGIDIFPPDELITPELGHQKNLQIKNQPLFISSVYKYVCINSFDDDFGPLFEIIDNLANGDRHVASGQNQ